jgi:hypothetical protein
MALRSTSPITEIRGKGGRCIGAENLANFMFRLSENSGSPNRLDPSESIYKDSFTFLPLSTYDYGRILHVFYCFAQGGTVRRWLMNPRNDGTVAAKGTSFL